ncbi:hypothetical protein BS17DRAFT_695966, partial [Gyrodon lividus]
IYTRLLGQGITVINSEKVAQDLLDRRSQKCPSRPSKFSSAIFAILLYGERWRLHRRLFHQAFYLNAAPSFRPIQMQRAHELIGILLRTLNNNNFRRPYKCKASPVGVSEPCLVPST